MALNTVAAQQAGHLPRRTISIGGVGNEPRFNLEISEAADDQSSGRAGIGTIVVRNQAGAKVQTLTCDLSEEPAIDRNDPRDFVLSAESIDLDFDGLPDIRAVRAYTMKTQLYCIWLFDPEGRGGFIQDALSHQLTDLENLTVDSQRHLILSRTIGPTEPQVDEYRIDTHAAFGGHYYTNRRLLPVRSCMLTDMTSLDTPWTAIVVSYVNGQEVVKRQKVSSECNDPCADGCAAWDAHR